MSEIVDDLLQEVEQLEESTKELESSVDKVNQQVKQAQEASDSANTDASLLVLEASKTAQSAAEQSHKAAQASIKQAEQLKAQAIELNESNFNWRQAVRNAAKDLQAAKSSFAIMMSTAIVISIVAVAIAGYLVYSMQKQQSQFKGEVLDIIATENTLLTKKITLKIDELASVVENLTYKVSQLDGSIPALENDKTDETATISPAKPAETIAASDEVLMAQTTDAPEGSLSDNTTTDDKPSITKQAEHTTENLHQTITDESKDMTDHQAVAMDSAMIAQTVKPIIEDAIANHSHKAIENAASKTEMADLKTLVEKVIAQQQALQQQLNQQAGTAPQDKASQTSGSALSSDQLKKLNDISWLIRKQAKTLQAIETRIGKAEQSSKTSVSQELQYLKDQQAMLQQQLLNMQKSMQLLIEESKKPNPYSYKAK